jgi:hypothetical protein
LIKNHKLIIGYIVYEPQKSKLRKTSGIGVNSDWKLGLGFITVFGNFEFDQGNLKIKKWI